jgi:hypothetical protein
MTKWLNERFRACGVVADGFSLFAGDGLHRGMSWWSASANQEAVKTVLRLVIGGLRSISLNYTRTNSRINSRMNLVLHGRWDVVDQGMKLRF